MADVLVLIVVGLVVGALARLLMPGRDPIGFFGTLLVGVVGAILGGYLWREIFSDTKGVEWIGAVITAMALLWIYRRMTFGRTRSRVL